jgi:putative SOS response-associated peptidase YedK
MCGRMTLARPDLAEVAGELGADFDAADAARHRARYNIAPSDQHWLLIADGGRRIVPAVWGLPSDKRPVINVRAESLQRGAFRRHRHAVAIVDGFYEWTRSRQPHWYHRSGALFLLACVDAPLAAASARAARAFAVVTVPANAEVARVHERMPALLDGAALEAWLAGAGLAELAPAPESALEARAVSTRVNRVAHDDPACIAPAPARPARQLSLLGDRKH